MQACHNSTLFLGLGEASTLASVVDADQRDILKHPVCESYLHFKWLLVKKFFHAYIVFYTIFLFRSETGHSNLITKGR